MYRRRNMATTQVAEAEKNLHKHMTEKNKGKKAEDGRLTQRCVCAETKVQIHSGADIVDLYGKDYDTNIVMHGLYSQEHTSFAHYFQQNTNIKKCTFHMYKR